MARQMETFYLLLFIYNYQMGCFLLTVLYFCVWRA